MLVVLLVSVLCQCYTCVGLLLGTTLTPYLVDAKVGVKGSKHVL
jgi:hypothetical protein